MLRIATCEPIDTQLTNTSWVAEFDIIDLYNIIICRNAEYEYVNNNKNSSGGEIPDRDVTYHLIWLLIYHWTINRTTHLLPVLSNAYLLHRMDVGLGTLRHQKTRSHHIKRANSMPIPLSWTSQIIHLLVLTTSSEYIFLLLARLGWSNELDDFNAVGHFEAKF